ncbi:MAG: hypothetical protein RR212_02380 [Bacteroidales bacterium]
MLSLILVETMGISKIQHCCGSSEILLMLSEMDLLCAEENCETIYESHHHCPSVTEVAKEGCCAGHVHENDYCKDHTAPGFHNHHHDDNCLSADFLQLRPEQKQDNFYHQFLSFIPFEIQVFNFEPQPVIIPLTDKYQFTIPKEAGRYKLALYSVYLI